MFCALWLLQEVSVTPCRTVQGYRINAANGAFPPSHKIQEANRHLQRIWNEMDKDAMFPEQLEYRKALLSALREPTYPGE